PACVASPNAVATVAGSESASATSSRTARGPSGPAIPARQSSTKRPSSNTTAVYHAHGRGPAPRPPGPWYVLPHGDRIVSLRGRCVRVRRRGRRRHRGVLLHKLPEGLRQPIRRLSSGQKQQLPLGVRRGSPRRVRVVARQQARVLWHVRLGRSLGNAI